MLLATSHDISCVSCYCHCCQAHRLALVDIWLKLCQPNVAAWSVFGIKRMSNSVSVESGYRQLMRLRIATMILFDVEKNWSCFAYIVPLQLVPASAVPCKWASLFDTESLLICTYLFRPFLLNLRHCRISLPPRRTNQQLEAVSIFHHDFTGARPFPWKRFPLRVSSTVLDVGTSGQTARVTRVSAASGGTKRGLQGVEMIVSFHLFVLSFNGKRCLSHFCWWWNAGLNAKKITITVAKILEIKSICSNHAAFLLLPFLVLPFFFSLSWISFFFFPPKRFHKLFLIRKTKNFRICMTGKKIWGVTPGLLLQQCSSNYTSAICPSSCLCTCLVT